MEAKKPVKVDPVVKNDVARFIVGTSYTLAGFFTEAAIEKLSREQTESNDHPRKDS